MIIKNMPNTSLPITNNFVSCTDIQISTSRIRYNLYKWHLDLWTVVIYYITDSNSNLHTDYGDQPSFSYRTTHLGAIDYSSNILGSAFQWSRKSNEAQDETRMQHQLQLEPNLVYMQWNRRLAVKNATVRPRSSPFIRDGDLNVHTDGWTVFSFSNKLTHIRCHIVVNKKTQTISRSQFSIHRQFKFYTCCYHILELFWLRWGLNRAYCSMGSGQLSKFVLDRDQLYHGLKILSLKSDQKLLSGLRDTSESGSPQHNKRRGMAIFRYVSAAKRRMQGCWRMMNW